jgi:O-acetyl-ADP-ribose deacetylase (regulator of RNase III)
MNVTIVKGDVTNPIGDGKKIIVHCCNDINSFGSGVAGCIARKWPTAKEHYHNWADCDLHTIFALGQVQFVRVEHDISVCNLIGQRGINGEEIDGVFLPPVRYEALREGFLRVRKAITKVKDPVSLHFPMLGAGLAGGDWVCIYELIREVFEDARLPITIYAFDDVNLKLAQSQHEDYEQWHQYQNELDEGDIIA